MRVIAPPRLGAMRLIWVLGFSASRRLADLVIRRHSGGRSPRGTHAWRLEQEQGGYERMCVRACMGVRLHVTPFGY